MEINTAGFGDNRLLPYRWPPRHLAADASGVKMTWPDAYRPLARQQLCSAVPSQKAGYHFELELCLILLHETP